MIGPYTTWGHVDGSCAHRHGSLTTAARCLATVGEGTDRAICRWDGSPLSAEESERVRLAPLIRAAGRYQRNAAGLHMELSKKGVTL